MTTEPISIIFGLWERGTEALHPSFKILRIGRTLLKIENKTCSKPTITIEISIMALSVVIVGCPAPKTRSSNTRQNNLVDMPKYSNGTVGDPFRPPIDPTTHQSRIVMKFWDVVPLTLLRLESSTSLYYRTSIVPRITFAMVPTFHSVVYGQATLHRSVRMTESNVHYVNT